jgi:CheY-like chemotaxis protein
VNETANRKNMHQVAPLSFCARVLIADGSAWDRALLSGFLRRAGHLVRTVGYGTEALEVAGAFRPQVVFLDLRTPEVNGWEVCDQLRDNEKTGEAAIFGLMAHSPTEESARYRRSTFDAYLSKPVEFDLVGHLVRCAIQ